MVSQIRRGLSTLFLLGVIWHGSVWAAQDRVTLNFQNADIESVVKMMSQITGRNFLLDPRVKGNVTIISSTPIPRDQAYQVFLAALRVQGFAAVQGSGVTRILPETDAKLMATPTYLGKQPGSRGDQIITQIYQLQNESAAQLMPVLRPLVSPNNYMAAYPGTNTLVITDYADNVRRITSIVSAIDRPRSRADINLVRLKHASAVDMAQLLSRLMTDNNTQGGGGAPVQPGAPAGAVPAPMPELGGEASSLSIVPDMRTNSLLVRTQNPGQLLRIRALVATLDVPASGSGNIHVVYLRNAEAGKLAQVLQGLITGQMRNVPAGDSGNTDAGGAGATPAAAPGGAAGAAGRLAGPETVMVQPDEATNSIIITAPDGMYNALRSVIDKLDVRRAQVYVEALIAEVSEEKAAEFGIQWQGTRDVDGNLVFGGTNFNGPSGIRGISFNPGNLANVGDGLTLGVIRGSLNIGGLNVVNIAALARALESDANANILSTPNLLTLDNSEAKIVVAQNVPFVTGSYAQATATGTGAAVNPFQTIERRDVGLTLKIRPQISEGGGITLQIYQEVSSLAQAVATNVRPADIITNKRSLESKVRVDDGNIIVLGGLIQDSLDDGRQSVPILGQIPVLGNLFRYNTRRHSKTNLMVFLRPVVIRDPVVGQGLTQDRYDYIRGQQMNMSVESHPVLPYVAPPQLPPFKVNPPSPESTREPRDDRSGRDDARQQGGTEEQTK
ncbi:type II secretion system secretin GspD [Thermithiobacillus plumbiphilus]|uniref:Type II secretion system secretin GspD n=1 Tax=Thermithiobacillus plumbiphilus TaxID=1729899 RepID=A0ABU9DBU0_9PROT